MAQSKLMETAIEAARRAGRVVMENRGKLSAGDVALKQASDFVTRVDRESEQAIIGTIRESFPSHLILAEETLKDALADGRYRWIIDPLDGTTNYIHGYPVFSVSIALQYKGDIVLGVVLDPLRDELFCGELGSGAYVNGEALRVSEVAAMEGALITTGFPFRQKERLDIYLEAFKRIFLKASGIRRAGSAALDLSHLAAGRCDGFFELGLAPWDVAAGAILIREAGGLITDFGGAGGYMETGNIVAGNRALHGELLEDIRAVFAGTIDS